MSEFFRIVNVRGNPFQMGEDYGCQTRDLIRKFISYSNDFYRRAGYLDRDIRDVVHRHELGIQNESPEILEEIKGMSQGADVRYEDLIAACILREIRDALHRSGDESGCTTCIAYGPAAKTGNPVVGHNWDSRTDPKQVVVTVAKPEVGFRFVTIGPVGRPGCEGMNEKGLTIVMSGVIQRRATELLARNGPLHASPEWTHQILLHAQDVDGALEYCKGFRHAVHGVNWVVADPQKFCHVEIAYDSAHMTVFDLEGSQERGSILSTTNHYASGLLNGIGPRLEENRGSYVRKKRMTDLLESNFGTIDLNLAKSFLRNHDLPYPICRHKDPDWSTISSQLGEPSESRFWIAVGPPCDNEYRLFSLRP